MSVNKFVIFFLFFFGWWLCLCNVRTKFRIFIWSKIQSSLVEFVRSNFSTETTAFTMRSVDCSSHWPIIYLVKNDGINATKWKTTARHRSPVSIRTHTLLDSYSCVCVNKKNVYFRPIVFICIEAEASAFCVYKQWTSWFIEINRWPFIFSKYPKRERSFTFCFCLLVLMWCRRSPSKHFY